MSKREEIQAFVGQFTTGLMKLMREAAHETVDATFGEEESAGAAQSPKPARSKQRAKQPAKSTDDGLRKQVIAVIKANPGGCRGGALIAATGKKSWQLRPLLNELTSDHIIQTSGSGRGTTYSLR